MTTHLPDTSEVTPDPTSPSENLNTLRGFVHTINIGYTNPSLDKGSHPPNVTRLENNLHDLWALLIDTAKVTAATSAEQDRLVTLVLFLRELGIIRNKDRDEEATTSTGKKMWADLPFLAEDLSEVWKKSLSGSGDMTPDQRCNLAAFTARLVAVGVYDKKLSLCAPLLFRDALERCRSESEAEDGTVRADLLPACVAWFEHANSKLLMLSANNHTDTAAEVDDEEMSAPGELAVKANVAQPGFSIPRWLFWRQRFKELSRCKEDKVVRLGRQGFDAMIRTGLELGIDVPGEKKYWEKLWAALDAKLLGSGGDCCVGQESVEVDLDWAD